MPYGRYRRFGLRRRRIGRRRLGRPGGATSTTRYARVGRRPSRKRTLRRGHRRAMKQYLRAAEAKTSFEGNPVAPPVAPGPMNSTGIVGSTQWPNILNESLHIRAWQTFSPFSVRKATGTTTVQEIFSESGDDPTINRHPIINGRLLTWRSVQYRFMFVNNTDSFPVCVHMAWVTPRRKGQSIPDYIMPPQGSAVTQQQMYGIQSTDEMIGGTFPGTVTGPWIDAMASRSTWAIPTGDVRDHMLRLDRRFFNIKWQSSFVLAAATTGTDGTVPGVAGRPPHKIVSFRRFYPSGWTMDYQDAEPDNGNLYVSTRSRPPSMLIWWHAATPADPAVANGLIMRVYQRTTYSDPN